MGKGTNFIGQPLLTQLLKFFDKDKILRMSRKCGGERYVKSFDGWHHLVVMLYAVLMRFDLRNPPHTRSLSGGYSKPQ